MTTRTTTSADKILTSIATKLWEQTGNTGDMPEITPDTLREWTLQSDLAKHQATLLTMFRDIDVEAEPLKTPKDLENQWQHQAWYYLFLCKKQHAMDVPIQTKEIEQLVDYSKALSLEKGTVEIPQPQQVIINEDKIALRSKADIALIAIFSGWDNADNLTHFKQTYNISNLEDGVVAVDSLWRTVNEKHKGEFKHPLAHIISEYMNDNIPKIEPERRQDTAIAPEGLRTTTRSNNTSELLDIGSLQTGSREIQENLFPLKSETTETQIVPTLPLEIYEASGGKPYAPGRGAPIAQRIFFSALLAYPTDKRTGEIVELKTTLRDIKNWLYPKGDKNPHSDFINRLREALVKVHNSRYHWERREWHIIGVDALPDETTQLDDPLPFTIKLPEGMPTKSGAMIDVNVLRHYGVTSAPKFRAWLRLAYIWDKAKIKNGGYRIYATIPKVKRDNEEYLLDVNDEHILSGDIYKSQNGELKAKQGNEKQKKWYHPQAIMIGGEKRNPLADKTPILSNTDMVNLFYDNESVSPSTFRRRLARSREFALEMEKDGHIIVEKDVKDPKTGKKGWRILEPRKNNITEKWG